MKKLYFGAVSRYTQYVYIKKYGIVGLVGMLFLINSAAAAPSWKKNAWANVDDEVVQKVAPPVDYRMMEKVLPFSPNTHNIGLDLGQIFLMGQLMRFQDSIGIRIHYTYGVSSMFGFDLMFGYSEHSDSDFTIVNLSPGLRFNLPWYDRVVPYFLAGLGFYKPSYRDHFYENQKPGSSSYISPVLFGVHFGTGVDLQVSQNVYFGAGLTFHNMFAGNKKYSNGQPFYAGGIYTAFLLTGGYSFLYF